MSILDRAKTHFENIGVQSIEVSEWKDDDGKPTVIYWNPINLFEKNKLFKKSDNLSDVSILADIVVMKALDQDGKKLFVEADKASLRREIPLAVLLELMTKMQEVGEEATPDAVKSTT